MKVVIVGYGSIGKRHVNNLISLGINDITLCRINAQGNQLKLNEIVHMRDIIKIFPDFVIVSNPTFLHYQTLEFLIQNQFNILCEKPLLHKLEDWKVLKSSLDHYHGYANVVFNLRYHPCVSKVKEILNSKKLGSVNYARFFVGQYLPDWRLEINHLESYSASKKMGGGVVLDLVHEIDLAEYLLGKPQGKIQSITSRVSNITVDSDDIAEIIYQGTNNSVVNIHLDYLYRGNERYFMISGKEMNLKCDLFNNTIQLTGDKNKLIETFEFKNFERNDIYYNMLNDYIKGLTNSKHKTKLPSFYENESVMNTCFQINN